VKYAVDRWGPYQSGKEREMFWKKQGKPEKQLDYDRENWRPVLKCSICNGERVAGFKNIRTGEFKEESFIRSDEELEAFKRRYGISEMKKEY
jgi:hypothetical protein